MEIPLEKGAQWTNQTFHVHDSDTFDANNSINETSRDAHVIRCKTLELYDDLSAWAFHLEIDDSESLAPTSENIMYQTCIVCSVIDKSDSHGRYLQTLTKFMSIDRV